MLLYVECARRLVNNDVHPPWIVLAVLCHLWLSAQGEADFSGIFAPSWSPFFGSNRHRPALDIIDHFQMVRGGGDPEEEEVAQELYNWAQETLNPYWLSTGCKNSFELIKFLAFALWVCIPIIIEIIKINFKQIQLFKSCFCLKLIIILISTWIFKAA